MKKNSLFIIILIPIIVFFIVFCQNLLLNNKLDECNNKENKDTNTEEQIIYQNSVNIFDCQFTVTYRIVDLLDGYIAEVPEYSYIVVDKFQDHVAMTHKIPTKLKNNLEINKYYEFTYHISGTGNIDNIYDVINNIHIKHIDNGANNYSVTLSIEETDKMGLEQIQENICGLKNTYLN